MTAPTNTAHERENEPTRPPRVLLVADSESAALLGRLNRRAVVVGDRMAIDAIGPGAEVVLVGTAHTTTLVAYLQTRGLELWTLTIPPGTANTVAAFVEGRAAAGGGDLDDAERGAFVEVLEDTATPVDLGAVLMGCRDSSPLARGFVGPVGIAPAAVLAAWGCEGPLVHLPTGIDALDAMTGGGPTVGSRVFLVGAPDAGKTALSVQVADRWALDGIAVGFLAVDEEPSDLLQRFLQRRGIGRRQTELREPADLEEMARVVRTLGVTFFDGTTRLEDAAEQVGCIARERGSAGALFIDSLQAIAVGEDRTQAVGDVVARARAAASRHRLVVWATSEMNRSSYRNPADAAQLNGMAAGADSRAIEFQARVLLNLHSVPGENDLAELRIVKNKLGPRHGDGPGIVLQLDRAVQTFAPVEGFVPSARDESLRDERREREQLADAAALAVLLLEKPGLGAKELGEHFTSRRRCGSSRFGRARAVLGDAIVQVPGPRTAKYLHLDGAQVADEVLEAVPLDKRPAVRAAVPPLREQPNRAEPSRTGAAECASRETRTPLLWGAGAARLPPETLLERCSASMEAS